MGEDFYVQVQAFMDYLNSMPPLGEEQLLNLGAAAPLIQLFQGFQQGDLQRQYYENNLAELENQSQISRDQLESNEIIQGYLRDKAALDLQAAQQQLLTGQEYTAQAQEGTKQSMNQTQMSAYNTESARYAADAAKFQALLQQGMVNQPAGYSLNRPYGT